MQLLTKQKTVGKVVLLPIEKIKSNPNQPRKIFDQNSIEQLAQSIAQYGLLQPITVNQSETGYELIAGERRLLACRKLKMDNVPAIISNLNEQQSAALALIENIQRCDLNFFEEAEAFNNLTKILGETQQSLANRLGKNQSTIANKIRLLHFSDEAREQIIKCGLTERHARALLPVSGNPNILEFIRTVYERRLNVSQTEKFVEELTEGVVSSTKSRQRSLLVVKDLRLFMNSIDKAVKTMKLSGIQAMARMEEEDDCIVYTVKIPKESALKKKKTNK